MMWAYAYAEELWQAIQVNCSTGAGENNTPFQFVVVAVFVAPPHPPNFNVASFFKRALQKGVFILRHPSPSSAQSTLKLGGGGRADEQKHTLIQRVLFSPAPDSYLNIIILIATESIAPS